MTNATAEAPHDATKAPEAPALGWYTIEFGPERIEVQVVNVRDVAIGLRAHADQEETRVFWQRRSGRFRVGMSLKEWHARGPVPSATSS